MRYAGLVVFVFLNAGQIAGVQQRIQQNDEAFVQTAVATLQKRAPAEQLTPIDRAADQWRRTRSARDFVNLTDEIYRVARATGAKSDVTINGSKGTGASVKYQTLGERDRKEPPTTAKDLTSAKEQMFIGMYHVWCERGGKPTSDKDAKYDIARENESITCAEK